MEKRIGSEQVIYSTTLQDGRVVCVYGPNIEEFFKWNGDSIFRVDVFKGNEKMTDNWHFLSGRGAMFEKRKPVKFMGLPQRVLDSLNEMGREFYEANKERLQYRHDVRDRVLKAAGLK